MKYLISESRLQEFINRYFDNMMDQSIVLRNDPYIYLERPDSDEEDIFQYMEWDRTDGRLWINRIFLETVMDTFGFDKDQTRDLIGNWFEKEFDVKVKFFE
jgi:hypothetical protein